ncbi:ygiB [Klebsiella pneumoniae subsp. rhinoscleromatis]|nr:ygiB [Klebsiella pneumoniae subsp. rhinoscleromatis]
MHHGLHQRGKRGRAHCAEVCHPRRTASPSLAKASGQQTPAQAGVAPENQAQAQSSGSFWMPLMAGLHDGPPDGRAAMAQQQPLFSSKNPASPAYGQYTDASGKSYGAAQPGRTMNVPKTAMAPKPATTTTVTRGRLWRVGSETVDHAA